MGKIYIEGKEIANVAQQIVKSRRRIKNAFDALKTDINNTNDIWGSAAQDELAKKYKKAGEHFDGFHSDLQEYEKFLIKTAEEYGYSEAAISNYAGGFR